MAGQVDIFAPPAGRDELPSFFVGREVLAAILGVHERTINRFYKEGMPRIAHGRYDVVACVQWALAQERARASESSKISDTSERKRYDAARASAAEMELAARQRDLIAIDEVRRVIDKLIGIMIASLEGLPPRAAPVLAPVTDPIEVQSQLRDHVNGLRNELAAAIGDFATATTRRRRTRGTAKTNG